jgi:hypothetical protein
VSYLTDIKEEVRRTMTPAQALEVLRAHAARSLRDEDTLALFGAPADIQHQVSLSTAIEKVAQMIAEINAE